MLKILHKELQPIIDKYKTKDIKETSKKISDDCPIWVMWWQGFDAAPEIVLRCKESVEKHKGNHSIFFLDKHNYNQYVEIPVEVIETIEKENNIAYISDLVRFKLLSTIGGLWLDATIFVTKDIACYDVPFYTIHHRYDSRKFVLGGSHWTSFMLGSIGNGIYASFVYECLLSWLSSKSLIDYHLTDYIIALGYLNIPKFKEQIDNVPMDNIGVLDILFNHWKDVSDDFIKNSIESNTYHKLDWHLKIEPSNTIGRFLEMAQNY